MRQQTSSNSSNTVISTSTCKYTCIIDVCVFVFMCACACVVCTHLCSTIKVMMYIPLYAGDDIQLV